MHSSWRHKSAKSEKRQPRIEPWETHYLNFMLRNRNQQEIEKNLPVICTVGWKLEGSAFIGAQTTEESEEAGLKLNIQKWRSQHLGPITSWQIDGENGNSDRLYFGGPKITVDGDCSYEIKRCLLWKKSYDKSRQSIKKQRHHFADKGLYSQTCGFSRSHVWMRELDHKEGWGPRIDAFKLWCLRRPFRVPWTSRRSNQSILEEIHLEYSLKGLILNQKHGYFDHLIWRADSLENTLLLEKVEGKRKKGQQRMRWLDGIS